MAASLSKTLICLLASCATIGHLWVGTSLASLASGLSIGGEASVARQYTVESVRFMASLGAGWNIAGSLSAALALLGVLSNYEPSIRLYAMQSIADSVIWSLVVLSAAFTLFNPAWSNKLMPALCEELTSGELFTSSASSTPTISSLFFKRSHEVAATQGGSFNPSNWFESLDQCVEHIQPALATLVLISFFAVVLRIRLGAFVYSYYQRTKTIRLPEHAYLDMSAPDLSRTSSAATFKGRVPVVAVSGDEESDVEASGARTPVAGSSSRQQYLSVPSSPHAGKRA